MAKRRKSVNTKRTLPAIDTTPTVATVNVKDVSQAIDWKNSWALSGEPDYVDPDRTFTYQGKDLRAALRRARHVRQFEYTELANAIGLGSHNPVIGFFRGEINSMIRTVEALMVHMDVYLQYRREILGQDTVGVLHRVCKLQDRRWTDVAHHLGGLSRKTASGMVNRKTMPSLRDVQRVMNVLSVRAVFDE